MSRPTLVGQVEDQVHVYNCDANDLMDHLEVVDQKPDLIFMDPPFNIGEPYGTWDDQKSEEDFLECLERWFTGAEAILADTGSLWVNIPDQWAAECVCHLRHVLHMKMENWCLWHFRFAQNQPYRFLRSKTHALWFSKGDPFVDASAALVPSDRAAIYDDPRIYDSAQGGMRMDLDVWGFERYWGRVQGNNKERRPLHPNQLPEKYLERIVGVCCPHGGLVLDPFCGSGTTATVARSMGRRCITGDIDREFAESALERIRHGAIRVTGAQERNWLQE